MERKSENLEITQTSWWSADSGLFSAAEAGGKYITPGSYCCCWCTDHTLNGRGLEDPSLSSLLQGPVVQSLLPILGLSSWPSYVGGKIHAISREIPQALPSSLPTYQPSSPQHPPFPLMTSDHPCSHDWKHTRRDFYITPTILPLFLWLSIHMLN